MSIYKSILSSLTSCIHKKSFFLKNEDIVNFLKLFQSPTPLILNPALAFICKHYNNSQKNVFQYVNSILERNINLDLEIISEIAFSQKRFDIFESILMHLDLNKDEFDTQIKSILRGVAKNLQKNLNLSKPKKHLEFTKNKIEISCKIIIAYYYSFDLKEVLLEKRNIITLDELYLKRKDDPKKIDIIILSGILQQIFSSLQNHL